METVAGSTVTGAVAARTAQSIAIAAATIEKINHDGRRRRGVTPPDCVSRLIVSLDKSDWAMEILATHDG
jgi:predicted TIM-barrel enzyme